VARGTTSDRRGIAPETLQKLDPRILRYSGASRMLPDSYFNQIRLFLSAKIWWVGETIGENDILTDSMDGQDKLDSEAWEPRSGRLWRETIEANYPNSTGNRTL
jgi:hypothetical protein